MHEEIIDLISEGYFYPKSSLLSSGKVKIKPISAEIEELLCSTNLIARGELDREFVRAVVSGGIDYDELLYCDKLSILLNTRIANYGPVVRSKIKCDKCDSDIDAEISLRFKNRTFDFSKYTNHKNVLVYTFPKCGKSVTFKLGTCEDHRIYEKDGWLALAKRITTDVTEVEDINTFYDYELGATDSRNFRKHYFEHTPGYINDVTIKCPSCGVSRSDKLDIDLRIFGISPESKAAIHGEIFDLCYYSNGAFTQDSVYKMPTSLRSFYIKKLVEAKKAEAEASSAANKGESPNSKIAKPPTVKS